MLTKTMSQQIIAVIANILVMILPYMGVTTDSEQLNTSIQTIVAIVTGIWIWYQRTTLQKAPLGKGDVNVLGMKKN